MLDREKSQTKIKRNKEAKKHRYWHEISFVNIRSKIREKYVIEKITLGGKVWVH